VWVSAHDVNKVWRLNPGPWEGPYRGGLGQMERDVEEPPEPV